MPSGDVLNPISTNHYRQLPEALFSIGNPEPVSAPALHLLNKPLLDEYAQDHKWFKSNAGLAVLSGNAVNAATPPIAMAYAGHQFGQRVPLLGDGRAHMLGQLQTKTGAVDVQLKGSGRTQYSRGGDGRATLSSVLREHLLSEAMAGLNIPSTRSLGVITTGDTVYRESPEPGAVLIRTARSHIRVGSFQHAANLGDDAVKALADHLLEYNYPELSDSASPYIDLLLNACNRQAGLISQWMLCGFIHGVMNTDNMSLVGETIDFGPCAFMDTFDAHKVFSSIDRQGRYAWAKQPGIALWNLSRFAETLLPLFDDDKDTAISIAERKLSSFMPAFQTAFYSGLRQKIGLINKPDTANAFADRTLSVLAQNAIDMTVFFDTLTRHVSGESETLLLDLFNNKTDAKEWLSDWRALRNNNPGTADTMRRVNPALIARNHRVEAALLAATNNNDLKPLLRLSEALRTPYQCCPENSDLQQPPLPDEVVKETFCGT